MYLAATKTYPAIQGFGNLGTGVSGVGGLDNIEWVISTTIGLMTVVGGIWFVFQILIGAYQWITAGGDKDGVQKSQKRFTNGFIGLVILLFSYTLIAFIGSLLGLNIFALTSTVTGIVN